MIPRLIELYQQYEQAYDHQMTALGDYFDKLLTRTEMDAIERDTNNAHEALFDYIRDLAHSQETPPCPTS